jgi:hypothetical protein
METNKTIIPARHCVNLGDLIYSLWALRQASIKYNAKIMLYQWIDRPAFYYEGAQHPTKGKNGQEVSMNKAMFDMVKPLIMSLDFIEGFEPYNCEKIAIDLDRCRTMNVGIPFGDIRKWVMYASPDLHADISEPIFSLSSIGAKLDLKPDNYLGKMYVELENSIIVNRTSRYRNELIHYGFLQNVNRKIYFAGTMAEYAEFQSYVPKANYLRVTNFLELALFIGVCELFIGNQSFCFSLAEALKSRRVLEVCSFAPNVIVCGENGYDYYDQTAFEFIVNNLLEK